MTPSVCWLVGPERLSYFSKRAGSYTSMLLSEPLFNHVALTLRSSTCSSVKWMASKGTTIQLSPEEYENKKALTDVSRRTKAVLIVCK